jgi:hypothetical protein
MVNGYHENLVLFVQYFTQLKSLTFNLNLYSVQKSNASVLLLFMCKMKPIKLLSIKSVSFGVLMGKAMTRRLYSSFSARFEK